MKPPEDLDGFVQKLTSGDRAILGRAISFIESTAPAHRDFKRQLLSKVEGAIDQAYRIAITGVPGVGKSTLIEKFGLHLIDLEKRVAILAVDPSSGVSGGSILGDKTRMQELSRHPSAFIRPSPAGTTLGGVTATTHETALLCAAAGYDIILIETVGVGQSEWLVSEMVDAFVLLMLPNAGDELQGIKRGIFELADLIAVNKADGDNEVQAREASRAYSSAMRYGSHEREKAPPILTTSGLHGLGLDSLWQALEAFFDERQASGALKNKRDRITSTSFTRAIESVNAEELAGAKRIQDLLSDLREKVHARDVTISEGVEEYARALRAILNL